MLYDLTLLCGVVYDVFAFDFLLACVRFTKFKRHQVTIGGPIDSETYEILMKYLVFVARFGEAGIPQNNVRP